MLIILIRSVIHLSTIVDRCVAFTNPKTALFVNMLVSYRCPITLSLDYVTMVLLTTVWEPNSNSDACSYDRIVHVHQ